MIDPQQSLYSYMLTRLREEGYTVYDDGPPGDDTEYPYILLGELQQVDSPTKSGFMGTVYPTIHIYHNNPRERGKVSELALFIKGLCWQKCQSSGWNMTGCSTNILTDTTTTVRLLHGIVEPIFKF